MASYFSGNYEDARYVLNEDGESYTYYEYKNYMATPESGEDIIPNEYNGKPVTEIGSLSFCNNTSLKSITISNNIVKIGNRAFSFCTGLNNVKFGDSLTIIESGTFGGCASLKSISIPSSVKDIGEGVFTSCTELEDVNIESGIEGLGYGAFMDCTSLKNIVLPETIVSFGDCIFSGCTALEEAVISYESAEGVYDNYFGGCTSLKKVTIKGGATIEQATHLKLHNPDIPDGYTAFKGWCVNGDTTNLYTPETFTYTSISINTLNNYVIEAIFE